MATGIDIYNPFVIHSYIHQLPWWRKVLALHFERFRVTEVEYKQWIAHRFR